MLRAAKVWRPRDWKILPWIEAGIDAGMTELASDPPEDLREQQGAFGVSRTVMLFGFFRARLASSTPDDPDAQVGDRLPFATVFGGGIRTYSDHD